RHRPGARSARRSHARRSTCSVRPVGSNRGAIAFSWRAAVRDTELSWCRGVRRVGHIDRRLVVTGCVRGRQAGGGRGPRAWLKRGSPAFAGRLDQQGQERVEPEEGLAVPLLQQRAEQSLRLLAQDRYSPRLLAPCGKGRPQHSTRPPTAFGPRGALGCAPEW